MAPHTLVKPVLSGHLRDKDNVPYKTGDLFKEVKIICHVLC